MGHLNFVVALIFREFYNNKLLYIVWAAVPKFLKKEKIKSGLPAVQLL
jgi:hypothetical protein